MPEVFVEQPLASPRSAKKGESLTTFLAQAHPDSCPLCEEGAETVGAHGRS